MRKKVLFITSNLSYGGTEKKTVVIMNRLVESGYDVSIAYLNMPDSLIDSISDAVTRYHINRKGVIDISALFYLRKIISTNDITHIVAMNLYPMLYAFISSKLIKRRVSVIASINTTTFRSIKESLQMVIYLPIMYQVDHIIFGCLYQKNLWRKKYLIPERKSTVIYNGVDSAFYSMKASFDSIEDIRTKYGIKDNELVIGTVARLMKEKGHSYAFRCVKKLVDDGVKLKYLVVGDGKLRNDYENLALELGIAKEVIFAGNQDDVRSFLGIMDVFILSSISVETFSNASLEAMSMSRPVIMTDISGAREMISSGINGLLVKPGDVHELVAAIKLLQDEQMRSSLSYNARQRVISQFSIEQMISSYRNLLDQKYPSGC